MVVAVTCTGGLILLPATAFTLYCHMWWPHCCLHCVVVVVVFENNINRGCHRQHLAKQPHTTVHADAMSTSLPEKHASWSDSHVRFSSVKKGPRQLTGSVYIAK